MMGERHVSRRYALVYFNMSEYLTRTLDGHWVFCPIEMAKTWATKAEAEVECTGLVRTARETIARSGPGVADKFWYDVAGGVVGVQPVEIEIREVEDDPQA